MDNDSLIVKLTSEKVAGVSFQKRRHDPWSEIYNLYRDIVETNELTLRQEVNIPLMKETKKTLLARIDDAPDIFFDCLEIGAKGREKEIATNEKWRDDYEEGNYEGVDIKEKNNVLLFGRGFKLLNLGKKNNITATVPHRLDIVVDPNTDPLDIETAKYWARLHIYRSLREVLADKKYTTEGKNELKKYLQGNEEEGEKGGVIEFTKDETATARENVLRDLGVDNFDDLIASDLRLELNEHFTLIWNKDKQKFVRHVVIVAGEKVVLYNKTLKETIGVEFWPLTTWADDIDTDDFWSDGMGDLVLTPNKVANIYYSALLENWTYRGMGMSWYLPIAGYDPSTFAPEPFGQYPAPLVSDNKGGFLSVEQVIKQMDIPAVDNNMVGIEFLVKIVERATAATAIEKGVGEKGQMTLGEVEKLVSKASERIVSISKFYRRSWKEFAWKWRKMLEANMGTKKFKLYKKGDDGGYFEKSISGKDWISTKGYRERVVFKSEADSERNEEFQELAFLESKYPNNPVVQKIVRRRVLEKLNLTPEEQREIEDQEKELEQQKIPAAPEELLPPGQTGGAGQTGGGAGQGQPPPTSQPQPIPIK